MIVKVKYEAKNNDRNDLFSSFLLFVYAATSKLWEYNTFIIQLDNSPYLKSVAGIIVWLVPTIESGIALMLTVKSTRFYGLHAALFLLLLFTFYIAGMLLSGEDLPCFCGGIVRELSWGHHLIFNLFFILASIAGIAMERKERTQPKAINKAI